MNISPAAATDEPAASPTSLFPAARISDRLAESLIEPALDAGRDPRAGRAARNDGWTPERIRAFLEMLAHCGVVEDAARAAGMSPRSAYNLRNSAKGAAFRIAWDGACHLARRHLADVAVSRALHGCVEVIMRDGKVWGERHRYDKRLTMAVLERLDRVCELNNEENRTARLAAQEFDQFLDIVCAGGEGAVDFIAARDLQGYAHHTGTTAANLERLAEYQRTKTGDGDEANAPEIDPGDDEDRAADLTELAQIAELAGDLDEVIDDPDMPFPLTRRMILETSMRLDPDRVRRAFAACAADDAPSVAEPCAEAPQGAAEGASDASGEEPGVTSDGRDPASSPAAGGGSSPAPAGEPSAPGQGTEGPPPPGWVAPDR